MNPLFVVFAFVTTISNGAYTAINYVPIFDFDGNLLVTDATVKLEHFNSLTQTWTPYNATPAEWVIIQDTHDPSYRSSTTMDIYWDFSDEAGDDFFPNQVAKAFKNQGPAFPLFKEHFLHGVPFSVVTARGHAPVNLQSGFEKLINLAFTDAEKITNTKNFLLSTSKTFEFENKIGWWGEYFSSYSGVFKQYIRGCNFISLSNPFTEHRMACTPTSACKALAVTKLMDNTLPYSSDPTQLTVVSFFDDEKANIEAVLNTMKQYLVPQFKTICFRVYDTSNPNSTAVQYDLSSVCKEIAPGVDDWQSKSFLKHTNGITITL